MDVIDPDRLLLELELRKRARYSYVACWAIAILGLLLGIYTPKNLKPMAFAVSAIGSAIGILNERSARDSSERIEVFRRQAAIAYEKRLHADLMGTTKALPQADMQAALPPQIEPVPIESASDATHLAIVAETGAGKSTLVQYLAGRLGGQIAVYDSDAKPEEWQGLDVIGRAGNFRAIAAAMRLDLKELQRRTELRGQGLDVGESINLICEEYSTVRDELKENDKDNTPNDWLKKLLRRGRKYGIRVILVSQQFSVEALGIQGQGDLRRNLKVIRLGKVAIEYAQTLGDESVVEWLKQQRRPAMLENQPTQIPDLSNFQPTYNTIAVSQKTQSPQRFTASVEAQGVDKEQQKAVEVKRLLEGGKTKTFVIESYLGFKGRRFNEGKEYLENLLSLTEEND